MCQCWKKYLRLTEPNRPFTHKEKETFNRLFFVFWGKPLLGTELSNNCLQTSRLNPTCLGRRESTFLPLPIRQNQSAGTSCCKMVDKYFVLPIEHRLGKSDILRW